MCAVVCAEDKLFRRRPHREPEYTLREVEPDRHEHINMVEPCCTETLIMPQGGNARRGRDRGRPRHQNCTSKHTCYFRGQLLQPIDTLN